jgi:hypothetical protein
MLTNRTYEELIDGSRLALLNARNQPDVQDLLAPYGYDMDAIAEGLALVDEARGRYQRQQAEYAEQYAATSDLNEKTAAFRTTYLRHLKLARVAFKPGTPAYLKLGLGGERRDDLVGFVAQARQFYDVLAADAALRQGLARYTVDQAALTAAGAALAQLEAVRLKQLQEAAEAQEATRQRDDVIAQLRGYMRDFYAVAEVALTGQPQLREKLGIVVRA